MLGVARLAAARLLRWSLLHPCCRASGTSSLGRARAGVRSHAVARSPAGTTLRAIERRSADSPDAAAYVRALRAGRFGAAERVDRAGPARARCARSSRDGLGARRAAARAVGAAARPAGRHRRRGGPKLDRDGGCVRALHARYRAARGGAQPSGDDPAGARARPRSRQDSIREALGRALFGAQRYEQAADEFEAVIERAPTNDFALFCLGRSPADARPPRRGAPAARAGRLYAALAPRLPASIATARARRPAPPSLRRHLTLARVRRRAQASTDGANARTVQLSRRAFPGGSTGSGRGPAFFMSFHDGGDRDSTTDRDRELGSPTPSPRSRCCSPSRLRLDPAPVHRSPGRGHAGPVRARLRPAGRLPRALHARGLLARPGPAADQAPALQPVPRSPRARAAAASAAGTATRA